MELAEAPLLTPLILATVVATAPVTDRKPNPNGDVLVAEYHYIQPGKSILYRTPKQFRDDLSKMRNLGFRPVTAREWLTGKMNLPSGASPVVITFDDAIGSQFRILENGKIDPNCAVGVWLDFAKKYPDFPLKATFFVLPERFFDQPKHRKRKAQLLKEWGCEIASHTVNHRNLGKIPEAAVKKEIAESYEFLRTLGADLPPTLAYPYGVPPQNLKMLPSFTHGKRQYAVKAAFLAGANPSPGMATKKFDRYRIPRVQACGIDYGLDFWLKRVNTRAFMPMVAP